MNIDIAKKITEIPTSKILASTECQQDVDNLYNFYLMLTSILSESSTLIEMKKQILMLEERKHKLHFKLKLKSLLAERAKDFSLLTASSLSKQTTNY